MKRIFLFALFIYLCVSKKLDYFENEKRLFNIPSDELPFNYTEFTSCKIDEFPRDTLFIDFLRYKNDKLPHAPIEPDKRVFGNDFIIQQIPRIWRFLGWQRQTYYDEEYWFYNNTKSNNTVFYLHGINGIDGLENMYLLNKLTRNASVYFSIYNPSFLLDHPYNRSYSDHIDNVALFVNEFKQKQNVALIGNSYGSIRITSLCRRINCLDYSKIILTDPLHLNLPYSEIARHIFFGIFVDHKSSSWRRKITTVNVLQTNKQRTHLQKNVVWDEWTIDTPFMEKHKHNLVLVIGTKDSLMNIDKTCYALNHICRVIYTNTSHGMVLFSSFLNEIKLF
jgi:hypothetical protein